MLKPTSLPLFPSGGKADYRVAYIFLCVNPEFSLQLTFPYLILTPAAPYPTPQVQNIHCSSQNALRDEQSKQVRE
jgi:hypothetical protein